MAARPKRDRRRRSPVSPTPGQATRKLRQARFFFNRASKAAIGQPVDADVVENFFEAAIVFGRSVLDHLGKEYGDRPGGRDWHRAKTDALMADPELGDFVRFLHDNRDVILPRHLGSTNGISSSGVPTSSRRPGPRTRTGSCPRFREA